MSFHSLSSGYTGPGSHSFLSMPRVDDSARNTAPPAPRETKGLPDEPGSVQQLIEHCLDAQAQAQQGPLSGTQEAQVAETIRSLLDDCLNGTTLDLQHFGESGLPGEYPAPGDVPALHPDAWAQLDGYVRGREGKGIANVCINQLAGLDSVTAGLARMRDLEHVAVTVPDHASEPQRLTLNLRNLQPGHPEKLTVSVRGDVSNLLVQVPAHAFAHASGTSDPARSPSVVEYFNNESGEPQGLPKTLAGVVYGHASAGFDQKTASKLNMNAEATRRHGQMAVYVLPQPGDLLKCHSMCMVWAMGRHQKIMDGKAGDQGSGIDTSDSIKKGIAAGYTDQVAGEEYDIMMGARAAALFDLDNFGPMVAQQLDQLQPGETAWFFVNSPGHAMILELNKQAQCSALLFDPNSTVLHDLMVAPDTQTFARTPIDSWLTPKEQVLYFPQEPRVGTLLRWVPPQQRESITSDGPPKGPSLHVDPAHIGSATFLLAAMDSHAPESVTRSIEAILDTKAPAAERLEMLRAEDMEGRTPLIWAGQRSQPDNVAAYVRAILAAPPDRLPLQDKLSLLRSDDPDSELPFLGHLADIASDFWPEETMHAYVREIASSSLGLQDKLMLLAGQSADDREDPPPTAAQRALHHAPGRVLAMSCGILDAQLPADESYALFEALDVDREDLANAVAQKMERLDDNPHPLAQKELLYLARWSLALEKAAEAG